MRHDYNVTGHDYTVQQHDYNVKRHNYTIKRHDYNDKRNDYKYSTVNTIEAKQIKLVQNFESRKQREQSL